MTFSAIPDPILWRAASRFHDWRSGFIRTAFDRFAAAGLIGASAEAAIDDRSVAADGDLADRLLAAAGAGPDHDVNLVASGMAPAPWRLTILLSPYDADTRRNAGYSMLNLVVPRAVHTGAAASARLLDLFDGLHTPNDTEFAAIHPERHSEQLKLRAYVPALTFGPMFAGVFWANFLGPGHAGRFDRAVLDALPVFRRRWTGEQGLFFAVTPDIATADSPETEALLVAMTEQLRSAMR